jgi:hypothetical protein
VKAAEQLGDARHQPPALGDAQRRQAACGAEGLQVDAGFERLGDQERQLPRRIPAALAEGDRAHGVEAQRPQPGDGAPFALRAQHRQAQAQQVLGDLAPADAAVDLGEVGAAVELEAQRAAALEGAVLPALEPQHFGEGIAFRPGAGQLAADHEAHRRSAPGASCSISSAARSGSR